MKSRIKYLSIVALCVTLSGCARECEEQRRSNQVGSRNYHIVQYSGSTVVNEWNFKGLLNNQEKSDGFYFYKGDTLIEISGTLVIASY